MLCEATCIFIIWLMLGVIFINYYFQNLELRWFLPDFRNPSWSWSQTAQSKNLKIAFREEFSFQIYNSFSTNSKQNGLLLISSINTKIGVIFEGLEDQFWRLKQIEKFIYRIRMLRDFLRRIVRSSTADCTWEASACVSPVQRSCTTYPTTRPRPNPTSHLTHACSPPCCFSPHRN